MRHIGPSYRGALAAAVARSLDLEGRVGQREFYDTCVLCQCSNHIEKVAFTHSPAFLLFKRVRKHTVLLALKIHGGQQGRTKDTLCADDVLIHA